MPQNSEESFGGASPSSTDKIATIAKNGTALIAFVTALGTAVVVIVTAYVTYGAKVEDLTRRVATLEEKIATVTKTEPRDLILEKCIELAAQRTATLANEGSIERAMVDLNCPERTIRITK